MHVVLLSGGSGKRLWPLSNEYRSKQYIKILRSRDGDGSCSMAQRIHEQLRHTGICKNPVICASKGQVEILKAQLGNQIHIAIEPERRDTFAAILLSCAYLHSVLHLGGEETVFILPVDPYADDSFFATLPSLQRTLEESGADISLMGVKPTYPCEKYGYILPGALSSKRDWQYVDSFVEKPSEAKAGELMKKGALWNCGVFCFHLSFILSLLHSLHLPDTYEELFHHYGDIEKNSFDYVVMEHMEKLSVLPFSGSWKDLGTWNTLSEEMGSRTYGRVILGPETDGTNVINELSIPVVVTGIRDAIVACSFDGILVTSKDGSSHIKNLLKDLHDPPKYEERRWGVIRTLDQTREHGTITLTRKILIFAGQTSSYHYHEHCEEVWTILRGSGEMIVDGVLFPITQGEAITVRPGQRHAVKATTEIEYIEIHFGETLGSEDIHRLTFNWNEIDVRETK